MWVWWIVLLLVVLQIGVWLKPESLREAESFAFWSVVLLLVAAAGVIFGYGMPILALKIFALIGMFLIAALSISRISGVL